MPIVDLFSHRKKVSEKVKPDVYRYDILPIDLRNQIIHIWMRGIGWADDSNSFSKTDVNNSDWKVIHDVIAEEHGLLKLKNDYYFNDRCKSYFLSDIAVDRQIDVIELSFRYIDFVVRKYNYQDRRERGIKQAADDAINDLNERFKRSSIGYRYESGIIIRIDSELLHAEVVRPALVFLLESGFEGPCDEYLNAHALYRAGEHRDAITNANNAFESTLKVICDQRKWQYPKGARASDLLRVVKKNGLFPEYLDNSFDQLSATLKSGLPEVRNEEGPHGQGAELRNTPDYVASYALHLAAAKILFLVEANREMK